MPPPPGTYHASFSVNAITYGFDILQSSYGEQTEANLTIKVIPWALTYAVVVQGTAPTPGASIGSKAVTRNYRAIVYTEADYLSLRAQRGQIGNLLTPREPNLQAVLTECKRSNFQDPNDIAGAQTIEVSLTMMQ